MSLTTTDNKKIYLGDGIVTALSFPYLFLLDADLEVERYDTVTLVTTVLTITTHYTVSGAGDQAGGTVTMVTPPSSTEKTIIRRVVELDQESDYEDYNRFPAVTVEANYDRLTMMVQQLQEEVNRCAKYETVVDSAVVSGLIEGTLAAGSVPSLKTDLSGLEWVDLDTDAIAAAVAATAADVVLTNADVVSTNADVVLTNADVVSTNADVVSASASAAASAASASSIGVNKVAWNCTSATQVVIANGSQFTGVDTGTNFAFTSARTFDITGTAGDLGALNTGTEASDTDYYLIALGATGGGTAPHVIGVTAALYASFTTADLTGNYAVYDDYKRMGSIRNDGSSNFIEGEYFEKRFFFDNVDLALKSTSSGTYADLDFSAFVPAVVKRCSFVVSHNSSADASVRMKGATAGGIIPTGSASAASMAGSMEYLLNSSGIIEAKVTAGSVFLQVTSYYDNLETEGQ